MNLTFGFVPSSFDFEGGNYDEMPITEADMPVFIRIDNCDGAATAVAWGNCDVTTRDEFGTFKTVRKSFAGIKYNVGGVHLKIYDDSVRCP